MTFVVDCRVSGPHGSIPAVRIYFGVLREFGEVVKRFALIVGVLQLFLEG